MPIVSPGTTGRRWKRPPRTCPPWCARDHQCTAQHGYPGGEHRSDPLVWRTPYGRLVATRVESIDGGGRMEIRVTARLATDKDHARAQSQQLAVQIDEAVRRLLVPLPAGSLRSALSAASRRALP